MSGYINELSAIDARSALAQRTRIAVFRELAAAYPDDVPSGEVARRCGVPQNQMSSHLVILTRAGLPTVSRGGRVVRCRASLDRSRDLIASLARDCCVGHPELCMLLAADLSRSCVPKVTVRDDPA